MTPDEEAEYLKAAFEAYNTRKWYSNYSESYIVGYGKGGAALQQFAMLHPTAFIAGGFVDAADGISVCSSLTSFAFAFMNSDEMPSAASTKPPAMKAVGCNIANCCSAAPPFP